ncbi:uncharacterized protein LOC115446994 isoform X3 [Manduca sexta]|uniref:Uncharacterized protein n=1 Tax=Manduca sexta TaxID=7130 RepID=A0A921ZCN6_MANSE|nr:uncharacterized protein LOC115446994 isoform X3 [Manduca sexta]KAG6455548.1 hypothetical protein O3G_MSEX009256 [Manduca sexta]
MTSEIEALKTSEFLRRRKLRLQQVREQSKDIAKKIRQRAKVEKLRQVVELDAKKQKEYFHQQSELVKKLEDLYSKGIDNVGASHKSASESGEQDGVQKLDISKLRGREAAAELRRKKQEKLDKQKKLLDRKLQAREAANEISREKSTAQSNKLANKTSGDTQDKDTVVEEDIPKNNEKCAENAQDKEKPITNDMATQWDLNEPEWEPNIPALSLPKDESAKENVESRSEKSKRLDLFALSDEMPSSLRGAVTNEERVPIKSSMTMVSEYLKNRSLRLREASIPGPKKPSEDLLSIKETILHTRTSRPEGTSFNACCVLDEQLIPMPSWQAEQYCGFCSHNVSFHNTKKRQFHVTNSQINKIFSSKRPVQRDSSLFSMHNGANGRRNRAIERTFKSNTEKSLKSSAIDGGIAKKNSVTVYNHSTRDTRDIVHGGERLVVRDQPNDDDAYSQARRETIVDNTQNQEHQKKMQEMRHKVAMTKQNVEKEYKDTINFLNSLPKDKDRPRKAYMDEHRQQIQKENREQKLQQEYKKIEKECKKHICTKSGSKSKSPVTMTDDEFNRRDFQYSWMPVPESDGNLAIHTIPTTVKQGKSGNTVKFSKVDSYHEYRSRHRHTPPTKDISDRQAKRVEAVIIDKNSSDVTDYSSNASESSLENIKLVSKDARPETERELSDAERIIIYKILDSRTDKKCKKKQKLMKDILTSLNSVDNNKKVNEDKAEFSKKQHETTAKDIENTTFEHLNEGVYKTVSKKGDNITSMSTHILNNENIDEEVTEPNRKLCYCQDHQHDTNFNILYFLGIKLNSKNGDNSRHSNSCVTCKCDCAGSSKTCNNNLPMPQQSAASVATSINSFRTATNDKASSALPDSGYVKLIDDGGQEAGKFYIGASGILKNDAYEVVIQLRKKDDTNDKNEEKKGTVDQTSSKEVPTSAPQTLQEATVKETIPITAKENTDPNANEMNVINQENQSEIIEDKENTKKYIQEKRPDDLMKNFNAQNGNNPPKLFVDKGVHTSFQMSYAIPSHVPKVDSTSRPATSAYTQTTLSSPNQRPVFFHMSSSTSTAYMSPPELVLPQFLRQDYHIMTDEEKYDTMHILNNRGYISEQEYNEDYHRCRCKKCTHAKKITNKMKLQDCCRKHTKYGKKLNTPPNTARSQSSVDVSSHKSLKTKYGAAVSSLTRHPHKHKQHAVNTNSQNVGVHKSLSTTSNKKNKVYPETRKYISRSDLNPVLKNYINELLALNKENLRAIEVADQDCSAVTTPGSSIINVTNNINKSKPVESKISLEQIKNLLKQQIVRENTSSKHNQTSDKNYYIQKNCSRRNIRVPRISRKKPVHKVKSLNISKKLQKSKIHIPQTCSSVNNASPCSSIKEDNILPGSKTNCRSDISNTSNQQIHNLCSSNVSTTPVITTKMNSTAHYSSTNRDFDKYSKNDHKLEIPLRRGINSLSCYRSSATSSSDTNNLTSQKLPQSLEIPNTTSTQTSQNIEAEINLIKLAENKLQNMEKIADLTEKCTKRLSNLAKVLEEVRKNKSLVYSQISTSDSTSDSDQKSDKHISHNLPPAQILEPVLDVGKSSRTPSPMAVSTAEESRERNITTDSTDFVPLFKDIPKSKPFKITEPTNFQNTESLKKINPQNLFKNLENTTTSRGRPPPALSRITLKNGQDNVIPHELSTVLEVDSLLSVRLTRENKSDSSNDSNKTVNGTVKHDTSKNNKHTRDLRDYKKDPDLVRSNVNVPAQQKNISGSDSSDDSKLQAVDINQFNDIMLKPFITFQEHAKKCNLAFDEASNLEDIANDVVTDDISSLHSDGSLPDVIAELLKRNIISEPFKFDSVSNLNSTTVSSESALSVLALSKVRKDKKKQSVVFQNKENVSETSDSLSLSSNPDLEMAFKKLGMGWASSTLKKTKERLALSSSTNTSSSSLSQFKLKSFNNKDIPVLVTDSVSSILNVTKKPTDKRRNVNFNSKNAEQQTSLSNSMTVKEFLTNELAKKITFTNKSHRDETGEEFVSLLETKMPEDMKDSEHLVHADHSAESVHSTNNRARTSTPVQIFKSMTYNSSSSSNISNGLFSNADDLSSVKVTSNSNKNHSTSDKDDLTVPSFSLRKKKSLSDCSKSDQG